MIPKHAELYEVVLLLVSMAATPLLFALFTLKLNDLLAVLKSTRDGATKYHTVYKFRHEVILLGISVGVLVLAISGFHNPSPPSAQTMNWITFGIMLSVGLIVDAIWTFQKRKKLPDLITEEERRHNRNEPIVGGRRTVDPKPQ